MPTVKVRNLNNIEVGEVTLADAVFGVELNESLIHTAVKNHLANRRQGTSATKTRGNVSGSGRKLWKQKGTGRARIASLRSPLWKGGGNVHGPQPRDWSSLLPKKMRRGALRSALSERLREGNIIVVDEITFANPKTKEFLNVLTTLGLADAKKRAKTLIVDSLDNANLILSSRNVKKTKVTNSFGLNIYDLIYHEKLVLSKTAVAEITHLLDPKREKGVEAEVVVETVEAKAEVVVETVEAKAEVVVETVEAKAEVVVETVEAKAEVVVEAVEPKAEAKPKAKKEAKPKAAKKEVKKEETVAEEVKAEEAADND